jgi:transposase
MRSRTPKDLTACRAYFAVPETPRQRQYEALRAYFVEGKSSADAAQSFGYTTGTFRVMCHEFRRNPAPAFFAEAKRGPKFQPQKSQARVKAVELRKLNHSVYEISDLLKAEGMKLSPTAVGELLKAEGFARLPRRLDDERPGRLGPAVQAVADARAFNLDPRRIHTQCAGIFLFVPDLVRLRVSKLSSDARLPGSKMVPAQHALRACLALKLVAVERKSHAMSLVADEGLSLFAGLNAFPKKSFLAEYSTRIDGPTVARLTSGWHRRVAAEVYDGRSFNLDFHSIPFFGDDATVEKHYIAMRGRRQPGVLTLVAQDAEGRAFCYSNADIRKGEEAEEIFNFIKFWKKNQGELPRHLVFDSTLTTHANLARIAKMGITFITLRRRSKAVLKEVNDLPESAWRRVTLNVPTRQYKNPRVFEKAVTIAGAVYRQIYVQDLGHDQPTVLLTNDKTTSIPALITRYAQRMLVENAISDAIRFFHSDALSSAIGLRVGFDMALMVMASGLYRLLRGRMRGYNDAQARTLFRDIVDMPGTVEVTPDAVSVKFHNRAHLPIVRSSSLVAEPVSVPWWGGRQLRLAA